MSNASSSSTRPTPRILVVDDDRAINRSLVRKFSRHGCTAIGAYDGHEALEQLRRERFDGVLLDLLMPVEDGFQVLAQRGATPNAATPVYVLTSLGRDDEIALARQFGVQDVFIKNETSPAQVVETVCRAAGVGSEQP